MLFKNVFWIVAYFADVIYNPNSTITFILNIIKLSTS